MRSGIGISIYLNMHKSQYKFVKKRNKCDVTIKSTITKRIISGKKRLKQLKKFTKRETKLEREREKFDLFEINNNKKNN